MQTKKVVAPWKKFVASFFLFGFCFGIFTFVDYTLHLSPGEIPFSLIVNLPANVFHFNVTDKILNRAAGIRVDQLITKVNREDILKEKANDPYFQDLTPEWKETVIKKQLAIRVDQEFASSDLILNIVGTSLDRRIMYFPFSSALAWGIIGILIFVSRECIFFIIGNKGNNNKTRKHSSL